MSVRELHSGVSLSVLWLTALPWFAAQATAQQPAQATAQQPAQATAQQPAQAVAGGPASIAIEKLSGEQLSASELTFRGGQWRLGAGDPLALDELRSVVFPPPPAVATPAAASAVAVDLLGGRLFGTETLLADEACLLTLPSGKVAKLPLETIRAIRFTPAAEMAEFAKALANPAADSDRIFLKVDGKLEALSGLVETISAAELKFQFEGASRTLPRERVFGVVLAQAAAPAAAPSCTLSLRDGSSLGGDLHELTREQVILSVAGSALEFARADLARLTIRSARAAWLSDRRPAREKQQALATLPRPWRRDQSVGGRTLTLGGRTYEKGLGVAARTELEFSLDGKFDAFAAVIGIDQETAGKGDCLFVVALDGEPVFTQRVQARDAPREVRLPLGAARTLTLIVEPGADLDLADHADWADARLLRTKP